MKVAIIHDHLAQMGGAEKVLQVLQEMYPEAPIYTLLYDKENIKKNFPNSDIRPSIIQKLPGSLRHYKWYMPFMPMAIEFCDLRDFDLIISSASAFAKGVITSPDSLHVCYCHTPTRYLWSDTHQYVNELKYNKYFKKIISLILNYVRMWDRLAADRVDVFVANSKTVQKRIKKYYKRDSEIIYPNIEDDVFYISEKQEDYFLTGCRLVPYKRNDIAIEAFKKLNQDSDKKYKLKIFGDGIDKERLEELAKDDKNIEFLGRVSNDERNRLYSKCSAFINPQREDFGITMVEAMASGRPVIALNQGGATETVVEGETGIFFNEESADSIIHAIKRFDTASWHPEKIREHALRFSKANFTRELKALINKEWEKHKGGD
ncbi:MAG: Glycosyl transferase group 1 [Candidatus Falkowbacteria bacterium GW2011_GWC2_38_22]|uniref:Glycosyl transferase group 1 n=1 Tax=Candidatus Falkowbacteria bacterium GW2011_GWE1_38_31 TaxID=1618638 RepID=A0A0G0MB44_9BACT|nr:MAG: Glycosyl transferase group 1 [Candidatus Falkowbacteria bacterium GW2011_GWF2_38_1205]KKQ62124.1 MAG: Glycosyl transferase group 1 [Candidatus Falkowbacteria bacterium GW2011_GWC2_38_22]KKQ64274.1 MAG: Glycosyl transferase group 1 [Candidatus Falkowbacteria bacterium GW2011_GWF1_38_22]KKQ66251.1 MAG: Glycosyl transferase group 1 [Candidatus Falkowbacteria bacterium GW2011_GWE2_38_254]KKQ70979.1 MAG: Glycosyl transferase group 1 [Candidatus Falkowbacteria bacterium GW2011_GWE1_38_31]KKQ